MINAYHIVFKEPCGRICSRKYAPGCMTIHLQPASAENRLSDVSVSWNLHHDVFT